MATHDWKEGMTVRTACDVPEQEDGSDWPSGQVGTLMTELDGGDWLVYVPGHGSPIVNERDFY